MLEKLKAELRKLGSKKKAATSAWFFKTDKGQYGYGDVFLGVTVPEQRKVARKYRDLPLPDIEKLLRSKEHEFRLTALIILVSRKDIEKTYRLYMKNLKWVNNWDLVDTSAPGIVGEYLKGKDKTPILKLAISKSLWERRVAMVSTYAYIKQGEFKTALAVAHMLLSDTHDLIHKAVGWMLREIGKKDEKVLEEFLTKHVQDMPRTTLRYAIERLPEKKRKRFMQA